MSLAHIQRLLWPAAQEATAWRRLRFLEQHHLLQLARTPAAEMRHWGLPARKVYALGPGGQLWLIKLAVDAKLSYRHLRREQVLHDVQVAEVYANLVEAIGRRSQQREGDARWDITWAGEDAAGFYQGDQPLLLPDGQVVVKRIEPEQVKALPFFVEVDKGREAHGRPSSD